ncbi:MAG: Rrf2 family transcriptional regulator [Verrucomicrobiales bacterium]|jgi:Rrf2 family protein|nr:Rrf2 family transcriptional regulator [Verrucomicrobiales bacterium]
MKLSKKSEYGTRALMEIALRSRNGEGWYQIAEIARASGIPEKFLEQILLALKNGGVLKSRRGIEGGYALNEAPEAVPMERVVALLDGAALADEPRGLERMETGTRVYFELLRQCRLAATAVLREVSLGDLVERVRRQRVAAGESWEYQI